MRLSILNKPASYIDSYINISKATNILDLSKLDKLNDKPIQQIWRDHFLALLIKDLVMEIKKVCDKDWIIYFEDRYLNFEKIVGTNK